MICSPASRRVCNSFAEIRRIRRLRTVAMIEAARHAIKARSGTNMHAMRMRPEALTISRI